MEPPRDDFVEGGVWDLFEMNRGLKLPRDELVTLQSCRGLMNPMDFEGGHEPCLGAVAWYPQLFSSIDFEEP